MDVYLFLDKYWKWIQRFIKFQQRQIKKYLLLKKWQNEQEKKQQLVNEVNILKELKHPNISKCYDRLLINRLKNYIQQMDILKGDKTLTLGDSGFVRVLNIKSEFAHSQVDSPELIEDHEYNEKSEI